MTLSKKSKTFLLFLIATLIIGFGIYDYVMKPPATIESKKVDFSGTAIAFVTEVRNEPLKWTNKVVILKGAVTSKDGIGFKLDGKVFCQTKEGVDFSGLTRNQAVKIKGRFIGYDDLMDELKIDQTIFQD